MNIILSKYVISDKSEIRTALKYIDFDPLTLSLDEDKENILIKDEEKLVIKIPKDIIGKKITDLRLNLAEYISFEKRWNEYKFVKTKDYTEEELRKFKSLIKEDLIDIIYKSLNLLKKKDEIEEDEILYYYDKQIKKYEKNFILMILFIFGLLGYIIYNKGGF